MLRGNKNIIFTIILLALLAVCMYVFMPVFLLFVFAVLFSFILDPFVSLVEKAGFKRGQATLIVFLAGGILVYFAVSWIVPSLTIQLASLVEKLKTFSIKEHVELLENKITQLFPFVTHGMLVHRFEEIITGSIQGLLNQMTLLVSNLVSVAALLVILPFMTYYIVKDRKALMKGILHVLPNRYFEMSYWIMKRISAQLGRYVRGWLFDALFVGLACGFGFWLIGIPNAVALGIVAGIGHLVPYFGPIIGGVPALIVSIIQFGDFRAAPLLLLLLLTIYIVDNGFFQPYVFSKSVDMHPLVIIMLIVAGSEAFGVVGMILAVPTATVLKTAAFEIYSAFKSYRVARI
ncbi:MAG: AI-2E family transporter [Ignavibacteriales bacterium]|nr:AI-2E family transporter [Ignavibacteriales bacterium]